MKKPAKAPPVQDGFPVHYWVFAAIVVLIIVDALWWGKLKRAFGGKDAAAKSSKR